LSVLYGREARSAITGITLIAGFASTIGWPLTAVLCPTGRQPGAGASRNSRRAKAMSH
jgi:hypothetical protein